MHQLLLPALLPDAGYTIFSPSALLCSSMTIVSVFNQKGGVGKTTTALNLAAALARRERAPYAIDLDPQAQLSAIAGVQAGSGDDTVLSLFQRNRPLRELLRTLKTAST